MKKIFFVAIMWLWTSLAVFGQKLDSMKVIAQFDSLFNVGAALIKEKKYEDALPVARTASETISNAFGKTSLRYAKSRYQESTCLIRLGRALEALPVTLEVLEVRGKTAGKNDIDYAFSLNRAGSLYDDIGRFSEAEIYYKDALPIVEQIQGKESEFYLGLLNNLAILYTNAGNYPLAEQSYLSLKDIVEQKYGKDHQNYANVIGGLAGVYYYLEQFLKAEPLFLETQTIYEKHPGKESHEYSNILNDLGILYMDIGLADKSEANFKACLELREKLFGEMHPTYAEALNGWGNLLIDLAQYEEAEAVFKESMVIKDSLIGRENPDYAHSLNNLGIVYQNTGRFAEAEQVFLESKAIRERVLGADHPMVAASQNNLAVLYNMLGQQKKVEQLLLESLAIKEKIFGKETPTYGESLNNLGTFYKEQNRFVEAEQYLKPSLPIFEKVLNGRENIHYAQAAHNLGVLYEAMGRLEASETLLMESKGIRERILGKEHPTYAEETLNSLANLYEKKGRLEEAKNLYLQALAIIEKTKGKSYISYIVVANNLAGLYEHIGLIELSCQYYLEANALQRKHLLAAARHLSELELNSFITVFLESIEEFYAFAHRHADSFPALSEASFDNALFYKGFLLQAAVSIRNRAFADTVAEKSWHQLAYCQKRLAGHYATPIKERDNEALALLEEQVNLLEKELARQVSGFGDAYQPVGWKSVQKNLLADEAAIEWIRFKKSTSETTPDSVFYAALVLQSNGLPRFVSLFEEKEWSKHFNCLGMSEAECAAKRYSRNNASPLYSLVWQPLDSLLSSIKTVFIAPSGQLQLLDFSALNAGKGKALSNHYHLVQLASTRSLAEGKNARQLADPDANISVQAQNLALLFGGVQYDADSNTIASTVERLDSLSFFNLRGQELNFDFSDTTLRSKDWSFLEGSQKEIENIHKHLEGSNISAHSFTGADATEEAFKLIGHKKPAPRILHLATHGFFFPNSNSGKNDADKKKDKNAAMYAPAFAVSEHPMIRSGLVLAGANHTWRTGQPFRKGAEDGILTAYEISQMNLRGTELVVLSACQTGLGDLHNNEGVYGLQRAFKIAGAKYLVMSLQRVPDGPTQEFMTLFYQKWLGKKLPLPDAFRAAQFAMRKKYPEQPLNWSGWVLVE